jgi:hypothetical protein
VIDVCRAVALLGDDVPVAEPAGEEEPREGAEDAEYPRERADVRIERGQGGCEPDDDDDEEDDRAAPGDPEG